MRDHFYFPTVLCVSTEDIFAQLLSGDFKDLADFLFAIGLRVKNLLHQIQHLLQTQSHVCLQSTQLLLVTPLQASCLGQDLGTK